MLFLELSTPREFAFGPELRLTPVAPQLAAEAFHLNAAVEEGLETLLMLNLDIVFPEASLRLHGTSHDGWGAADLLAVDPLGALHVFELKYAARVDSSLMQAVAYALSQTHVPDWRAYVNQRHAPSREFLARRIAGVWQKTRSDKLSVTQKHVPRQLRDRARLMTLVNGEAADADRAMTIAEQALMRLAQHRGVLPDIRVQPAVHLHVLVPKDRLPSALVRDAVELAKRDVRLNLWTAEIAFDSTTRSGRLRLSPVPIEYSLKDAIRRVHWVAPQALRGAIESSPALGRLRWRMGPGWASWTGAEGRVIVALHLDGQMAKVKLMLQTPSTVKRHHASNAAWSDQYQAERRLLEAYLAPNFQAVDGKSHRRLDTRQSVTYESRLPDGTPVEIRRSGTDNVSAEIRLIDGPATPRKVGELFARTLRDAIDYMQSKHIKRELLPYLVNSNALEDWLTHNPTAADSED